MMNQLPRILIYLNYRNRPPFSNFHTEKWNYSMGAVPQTFTQAVLMFISLGVLVQQSINAYKTPKTWAV